ncbi:glutamyl-Q tRNA(Asp) synthetase [Bifidobacterium samirii]|uniref:glutamyl-Q tRNA(Asp) synthetase n=1 Tax=Bifidobacterium samirii TaxID=2306974 RepID=UPI000F7F993C|nr:glutamyl-Q tRNA(Asp) synthetase [Bifidobacterium samirii]
MVGRFAPTPSGRMHLGNMYAMLAAWLSARARGGRMILRIEDIDRPRVLPDADRWIMDDLTWLGLDWDGEPVYQSDRLDRYEQVLDALRGRTESCGDGEEDCGSGDFAAGMPLVYPCFCSRADIRAASAPNEGDGFVVYPGTCRRLMRDDPAAVRARLAAGRQHSWRLAMPDDADGGIVRFDDRMYGAQTFRLARDLGDTVIRRADGLFAYQLAVTVDDLDMGVTDIVRGRDLLRSTALQLYIRGLVSGADRPSPKPTPTPAFAHLPLVDNAAGVRLAKRQRSLDMGVLRARGVTARQVVGYCAWLLGLQPTPDPCDARDLLDGFDWTTPAADLTDRRVPDDPFDVR